DRSGDYVGFAIVPFTVTFVQMGSALQMNGHIVYGATAYPLSAAGTVDPATGEFSVTGEITGICPFVYSGTGDGEEIPGNFTSPICPSGPVFLTKCGNGVIDSGENCEPGGTGGGEPCSARCRLVPAGELARCMATQCAGIGRETCRRRCRPARIRTLAYVVSECTQFPDGRSVGHQALRIRRGKRDPVTVVEFGPGSTAGVVQPSGTPFCSDF